MEALPIPLSSRAKPRDLRCIIRNIDLNGSATHPFVIPSEAEGSAVRPSDFPNSGVKVQRKSGDKRRSGDRIHIPHDTRQQRRLGLEGRRRL